MAPLGLIALFGTPESDQFTRTAESTPAAPKTQDAAICQNSDETLSGTTVEENEVSKSAFWHVTSGSERVRLFLMVTSLAGPAGAGEFHT